MISIRCLLWVNIKEPAGACANRTRQLGLCFSHTRTEPTRDTWKPEITVVNTHAGFNESQRELKHGKVLSEMSRHPAVESGANLAKRG
jgi:hypothetical protein